MTRLFRTADLRIGTTGRFVQVCFQFCAQFFHGFGIGILWHHNRSNAHQGASTERQIDGGAVPIVQPYEAAGRHMIMPRPATRERFGTSAVSATLQLSSSARTISLNAPTPPLR